MEKKLIEWFNKTGYPLELFAESILSKFKFITTSSDIYMDHENKLYRELDLHSEKGWSTVEGNITLMVKLLIECKKSEKPFILLTNKIKMNSHIELSNYMLLDNPCAGLVIDNPNQIIKLPNRSCTGFKLIQGFVNSDEIVHKAENTLMKSFYDFIKGEQELQDYYKLENIHSVTFPILLIDAPFFELKITENYEIKLEQIDSGILNCLSYMGVPYPSVFPIAILKKEFFEDFLSSVESFGKKNLQLLVKKPNRQIKNFDLSMINIISKIK